ncbi:MAG: MerR family transcriptional regulator [Terriglobia bacterium]
MPRNRKTQRTSKTSQASVAVPDKAYFRIGEVSRLVETKPYVLRYWETEFPTLRPAKTPTGHRLYRRKDVETIFEIKQLLYEKGFTIEGARRQLAGNLKAGSPLPEQRNLFGSRFDGGGLRLVERELRNILTILSRKTTVRSDK